MRDRPVPLSQFKLSEPGSIFVDGSPDELRRLRNLRNARERTSEGLNSPATVTKSPGAFEGGRVRSCLPLGAPAHGA